MYNPSAPIQTSPSTNTNSQLPISKHKKINLKPLGKVLGIIATTTILGLVCVFLSGFLSAFSANLSIQNGLTYFDPLITIAYILVFYSVSHYYSLTKKQAYNYLLLALFLSFTINFVEGSLILVFLAPILRKLKLIENPVI